MGVLLEGRWHQDADAAEASGGEFVREDAAFRNWVTPYGDAGPTGEEGFAAEPGRYHLYVSLACPWAHRTLIMRRLKGLEDVIGVSVVHPHMLADGWTFATDFAGTTGDSVHRLPFLRDLYLRADPQYTGRVTVPVLWDMERETIVSNESADILRMLDSAFDAHTDVDVTYSPVPLRREIDAVNAHVYADVNNGVYRVGFATRQEVYQRAFDRLFAALDMLEERLTERRYLLGDVVTEADWRLFPTLVRFDAVYHGHFKCNLRRITDYPALSGYLRDLYQFPGIERTLDFAHIKAHYYYSHDTLNPTRIVPAGPALDLGRPHGRDALGPRVLRRADR
ncbi:MAG: glutathione S-transferase family protein [Pseudomonadales bacterium]|jgi:putative glutathione S-transferase|nr:glutathione S-transferase family protein [Pseudomonadales bacterium]